MTHRKAIDPRLRSYLDEIAVPPAPAQLSDEERVRVGRTLMPQVLKIRGPIPGLPNSVGVQEVSISPGLSGRLYLPSDTKDELPRLVYAHGGGWVMGSIETHDPFCRLLSGASGIAVLSVEYRLAPEHPFPSGLEDLIAAYEWAASHAQEWGGDTKRLLLGGDSAGGNLAAVAANRICSAHKLPHPAGLLLLYPVTDHPSAGHPSYAENASGFGLEASLMRWLWDQYTTEAAPGAPDISPLRVATLPKLPPALVATAEYDVLRDEGVAYAEKLEAAGVDVTHLHSPDMHHNFAVHPGTVARFPQCVAAMNEFAEWLKRTV